MRIEYEATFKNIDKAALRLELEKIGATMIYPEFLMKRQVWHFPKGHEVAGGWVRVRQESDKITLSVKIINNNKKIEDQKEICLTVSSYEDAKEIIDTLGCQAKAYQESKRELWKLDNVEITLDEWPFLEPFVEIEGPSEQAVQAMAKKLGFDYSQAIFGSVDFQYADKYDISLKRINSQTPTIVFDMENPFID